MHNSDLIIEHNPTTWNDASFFEAVAIFNSLDDENISIPQIRKHFDLMVTNWFSDLAVMAKPNASESIVEDWKNLGRMALLWGRQGQNDVSLGELHETLVRKQRDYGHQNIARFGRQGLLIRVHDKIARLENLMKTVSSDKPNFESIQDTVMDIAGYSTIGMMWERGRFLLPLE